MHSKKTKWYLKKRIWIPLVLVIGVAFVGRQILQSDIKKTEPHVNHLPLGHLDLQQEVLTNYWGDTLHIEAGTLVVQENREGRSDNHILIAFQRFRSTQSGSRAPIFFLPGGPGTPGSRITPSQYFYLFKKLRQNQDVVVLDQRGTGLSIPNLRCRNALSLPTDITENIQSQLLESVREKCADCAKELNDLGIDLSSFNNVESAKDLEAVRLALKYDQIIPYGVSYGSELAQFYIKYFPSNVLKAIFAAPVAPDQGLKVPANVESQFDGLDSLVQNDLKLSQLIPDLQSLRKEVHDKLKAEPQFLKIPLMDAVSDDEAAVFKAIFRTIAFFKPYWKMTLTDEHLQMLVANYVGTDRWMGRWPKFYYQMSQGNFRDVGNILRNFRRQTMPNALFFTINGTTGYSNDRWQKALSQEDSTILSHFGISFGRYPRIYEAFGIKPIPNLNEPIKGDTKILLIGGTLDGRTPLNHLDTLSKRFPTSHKIIVENVGHNALIGNTILENLELFLADSMISDVYIKRGLEFINPEPYSFSIHDTLFNIVQSSGAQAAVEFFKKQRDLNESATDYVCDIGESVLNDLGYTLLNQENVTEAIQVFKANCDLFPERHNTHNSLGEAILSQGDTTAALIHFKKAVDLNYFDPYSQTYLSKLD